MYLKKNLDKFDPQSLKKTHLIFCDTECPWYPLEDGEHWPVEGLNYNTVLQLDSSIENKRNGQKCHICCSLSLCETCQDYVLKV